MSQTILITGASSGLGLAFLQHYTSLSTTGRIIAIDITPLPTDLAHLPNVSFFQADISSEHSISTITQTFINQPIDLLLHCAGIRGLNPTVLASQKAKNLPGDVAAAETYQAINKSTMLRTFEINTFGTFNLISTFVPNLLLCHTSPAKVVILSSRMGSIASNISGGGYAYRASKAALNAVVKSFSIDEPGVKFLLLHPGRVETGLVGWKEDGAIGVEESLRDCLGVIDRMEGWESGRLVDRFGEEIPW